MNPEPAESRKEAREALTLLRAIAQKEEQALARLYDLYSSAVFGCLFRILGRREEAEEVLLEVFWQVWEQANRYDPGRGAPFTWLYAIARSRALDRVRTRQRQAATVAAAAVEQRGSASHADSPEVNVVFGELRGQVRAALARLPADQREAIELAYYGGLTQAEIAARTGTPLGTVKTRVRLGLLRLREMFKDVTGGSAG
ncbi:MAG: sigma-70 family RNA polymerase sigma factor [Candidatus Methylomirabilales bacterium]